MVKSLLSLKEIPKPDDAADALAVAICHIHCADMGRKYGCDHSVNVWERV